MNDLYKRETWRKFCDKLIELTENGKLKWEDWSDKIKRRDSLSPLFVVKHKKWLILVYKYQWKYFHDEENYEWTESVRIELIQANGMNTWTIPMDGSAKLLLDMIQYKQADVDDLLGDLLGSEE